MADRLFTVGEEIANAGLHGLGLLSSVAGTIWLVVFATRRGDARHVTAVSIFGVTLILVYLASALYHGLPISPVKWVFGLLDNAAIYLLIAGTYTPFCLVTLRDANGWWLFGIVWGFAVVGIAMEAFWTYRPRWLSALVYLAMGWLIVVSFGPLSERLEAGGLWRLVAGGLAYTVGVVFYVLERIKYMHAVWHLWVLAGSVFHFMAVLLYVIR